ncbi:MAG: VOC family protein [Clostridia bacterium]|nr:VOC family protein [Clostridia bacterium]
MKFTFGHAAYAIYNMEAALDFYCNKLGFVHAFTLRRDDGTPSTEYIQIAPGQFIELFYTAPDAVRTEGNAFRHLCLQVDSCEEAVKWLESRGVTITRPISRGKAGNLQAWIADPDGNPVEVMEIAPDSMHATFDKK